MLKKIFGATFLRLCGWEIIGERPPSDRYVLVCAPHTSNWDFIYLMTASWVFETHLNWLGKDSLFEGPLGWFLLRLGGVPVVRSSPQNLVDQLAEQLQGAENLHLAIPPSGTRAYRDYWKSGFYHIARKADVPVVMGLLDYSKKQVGYGPQFMLTGDVSADMNRIRDIYFGLQGKFPDQQARIRLRIEDGAESAAPAPADDANQAT